MAATSVTKRELRKAFTQFKNGKATKTELERNVFGVTTARGKWITRQWANVLGVDTRNGQIVNLDA